MAKKITAKHGDTKSAQSDRFGCFFMAVKKKKTPNIGSLLFSAWSSRCLVFRYTSLLAGCYITYKKICLTRLFRI